MCYTGFILRWQLSCVLCMHDAFFGSQVCVRFVRGCQVVAASLPGGTCQSLRDHCLMTITSIHGHACLRCRNLAGKKLGSALPQSASDYGSLTTLTLLDLSNNDFTGQVPPVEQLTSLQTLELEGNSLTGPLPALAGFTSLTVVNFQENQFTGRQTHVLTNKIAVKRVCRLSCQQCMIMTSFVYDNGQFCSLIFSVTARHTTVYC